MKQNRKNNKMPDQAKKYLLKYLLLFMLLMLISGAMYSKELFSTSTPVNTAVGSSINGVYEDHFKVLESPRVTVIAEYYPDPYDPNSPYVRVYWQGYGSYKVFRSECFGSDYTMIAQNITQGEYIDTNWANLEPGSYMYGVRINTEAISWSNCLDLGMYSNMVSIMIQTGDGNSPEGAIVSFENHNSGEQVLYPMAPVTIDETGYYMWDVFRNGNYQITIEKSEYETIVDEVEIWENGFSMSYTLIPSNAYAINVSASPINGGSVEGGGTYNFGQSCTVTATPATGFTFLKWTENGQQVSTNAIYTFSVTGNRNLVANFVPQQYSVNVSANPNNGGTVSGGGTYQQGQSCTVTATANSGFTFTNWTENGSVVSNNANYTFTVTGNRTLVANFDTQAPNTYNINVSPNPSNGGTVSGGGTYNYGQSCTVTATPAWGFTFLRWTEDGVQVSTNADYEFIVDSNRDLVAHFTQQEYIITAEADPVVGGTIEGTGGYDFGEECTLVATANEGYDFINWTIHGEQVSTRPNYTFNVFESATYVAHFQLKQFVITAMVDPENGGTVTGAGTYPYGVQVTLEAIAKPGYIFEKWTKNNVQVSTNPSYTFTVTESAAYVAHFSLQQRTIMVSANPEEGGTVYIGDTPGQTQGIFTYGQHCTVHAMANTGYTFVKWTEENGLQVSTNADYEFIVESNRDLVAHFAQQSYIISASSSSHGSISPEGDVFVELGESITYTLIPDEGCEIRLLTIDDHYYTPTESITFYNVSCNHTIHAEFNLLDVEENETQHVKVSPNPVKEKAVVECQGMRRITVYNLSGIVVYDMETQNDSELIVLNKISSGIYLMKVMANGNCYCTKLIVSE